MANFADVRQLLRGQFQTPVLPKTNLDGKTFIVTGANVGLGFESAKHLAKLKASTLIFGCRNVQKGEAAKAAILRDVGSAEKPTIEVWPVDLEKYDSVVAFARRVRDELPRVDGFIANAGVSLKEYFVAEDYERTLTVNVISTFLCSMLILPKLLDTAIEHDVQTNLTIVGSVVHLFANAAELQHHAAGKILKDLSDPKTAKMDGRYFLSKLIVQQCIREMAERLSASSSRGSDRVVINCVNPGWCKTELFRSDDGGLGGRIALRAIGRSAEEGSRALVYAVTAGKETHGTFLSECQVKPESRFVRSSEGKEMQQMLWAEVAAELDRISPGTTDVLVVRA